MRSTIIAEVASNHGGELGVAEWLIRDAASAGADYIKFQSYQTLHLSPNDPQYDWLQAAELSDADHRYLKSVCKQHSIGFLTTVYHEDRAAFLASLHLHAIKIGSGEAVRVPLLREVAKYPWTVYLSTGLCTMDELDEAEAILHDREVVLMHTVSAYPTIPADCNMGRIAYLRDRYGRPVGYSDHTTGLTAPEHALSLGARAIEVHVSADYANRHMAWDKYPADLHDLCDHRDLIAEMNTVHPMARRPGEPRPFVGRWAHV